MVVSARKLGIWNLVRDRAQRHAWRSDRPVRFMSCFDSALDTIRSKGEDVLLHEPMPREDHVRLAAQVEALCAVRVVELEEITNLSQ